MHRDLDLWDLTDKTDNFVSKSLDFQKYVNG